MVIARTSMIHSRAPHFLWPYTVRYAAHQLNAWPRVSRPRDSPTSLWTGSPGVASEFRVWGCLALVRDTSADKLSARAIPCVFLGFPVDSPNFEFYHPPLHRFLDTRDIRFDESVSYYTCYPCRGLPVPPPPLFLAPTPPPTLAPLVTHPPPGLAPSGVSYATLLPSVARARAGGTRAGGFGAGGAGSGGAGATVLDLGGCDSGGAGTEGASSEGVGAGGTPTSTPSLPPHRHDTLPVSSTPISDNYRASRPVVSRVLTSLVTDPRASPSSICTLTDDVADFAGTRRLDFATHVVAAPPARPLTTGGEFSLGSDVLEDRQFELEFLAPTSPSLCAMLLSPEGDPNALDIPTPRTYRTYVDAVPPPMANVVDGMWIFKVKRPPGSPRVFKTRYVARGFS
ncbi:unnamed protein product [Closterium sp. NIES-54]